MTIPASVGEADVPPPLLAAHWAISIFDFGPISIFAFGPPYGLVICALHF